MNSSIGSFLCGIARRFSYVFRDKLRGNLLLKQYLLEVDLRHINLYNDELAFAIQNRPAEVIPLVSALILPLGQFD